MPEGTLFYDRRHGNGDQPWLVWMALGEPPTVDWEPRRFSRQYPDGRPYEYDYRYTETDWYPSYRFTIRRWGLDGDLIAYEPDYSR